MLLVEEAPTEIRFPRGVVPLASHTPQGQRSVTAAAVASQAWLGNEVLPAAQHTLLPTIFPSWFSSLPGDITSGPVSSKSLFCLQDPRSTSVLIPKNPAESSWASPIVSRLTVSPKYSGIN